MPKVFISYSNKHPDKEIAEKFKTKLQQADVDTFFAPDNIDWGNEWAAQIEHEISSFDFFLVFLSSNSKVSDMVLEEIRRAKKRYDGCKDKKPGILPVRINLPMEEGINYDVDAFLNKFQQRLINDGEPIENILLEAIEIIKGDTFSALDDSETKSISENKTYADNIPTPVAPLELPGGTTIIDSPYYISRKGEESYIKNIEKDGILLLVFAPRQYGKTSLLSRIIDHATKKGNYVASLSLQVLDESQVKSLDELLIQICLTAAEKCEIPFDEYTEKLDKIWETKLFKSKKKCDSFFEKYLLPKIDKPLVLVLDEVDRIFKSPEVSLEFFSLLRVWNDQAKTPGKEIFKKLKLVLAYSTEIYLAIPDINQSPFNIGLKIEPCEFTREEVNTLANKHGIQLSAGQLAKLYELIGGHPFLVRKALYHLACEDDASFDGLITNAAAEGGYFEDHLKRHLWNLSRKDNLLKGMKEVIKYEKATSYEVASRLQSAGLVVIKTPEVNINGGVDKKVTVKNKLYKDYFDNHID